MALTFLYKDTPIKASVQIVKGDTWNTLLFTATDKDGNGNDIPANLTGRQYRMQVKLDPYASSSVVDFTNNKFILSQSQEAINYDTQNFNAPGTTKDQLFINATSADMDKISGNWYFDLQETSPSQEVNTLISGRFKIIQDVTRGGT